MLCLDISIVNYAAKCIQNFSQTIILDIFQRKQNYELPILNITMQITWYEIPSGFIEIQYVDLQYVDIHVTHNPYQHAYASSYGDGAVVFWKGKVRMECHVWYGRFHSKKIKHTSTIFCKDHLREGGWVIYYMNSLWRNSVILIPIHTLMDKRHGFKCYNHSFLFFSDILLIPGHIVFVQVSIKNTNVKQFPL